MNYSKEQCLSMYKDLAFGRAMANKIVEYIMGGRINGAIHPSLGQEAISSGIMACKKLSKHNLYIHCTHRQQPLIADNVGLDCFVGELQNKRTGLMHGTSGEYHMVSLKDRHLPMQGLLGAGAASAVGFAKAKVMDGEDAVIINSIGDGAMSQGVFYETLNLAVLHHLPIVYVVENNQIAMSTPVEQQAPYTDLYLRAYGFNIPGMKVDGNDVEAVTTALMGAIEMAAAGTPVIVECKTWRWTGHYVGDMQPYRSTDYMNDTDPIDPLKRYEVKLLERGDATQEELDAIKAEQDAIISEAFQKAYEADFPTKEDCVNYNNLYSNNAGGAV